MSKKKKLKKRQPFYGSPFQVIVDGSIEIKAKTSKSNKDYNSAIITDKIQKQMPAYFMMSIANAMHEKVPYWEKENGIRTIKIRNQNEHEKVFFVINLTENQKALLEVPLSNNNMNNARWKILNSNGNIQHPHYLESYYVLSKIVSTINFR